MVSPIAAQELERFKFYACRIQEMEYSSDPSIHPSVYVHLAGLLHDEPLLPSLRHIHWVRYQEFEQHMLMFISPSLRHATIGASPLLFQLLLSEDSDATNNDDTHGLSTLLESLCANAPYTQSLTVEGKLPPDATSLIVRFPNLQKLDLTAAASWTTPNTFTDLGDSHSLIDLGINTSGLQLNDIPQGAFRALQRIEISGTPNSIILVISSISSKVLRHVAINSTYSFDLSDWRICIEKIAEEFSSTIRAIRVKLLMGSRSLTPQTHDMMYFIEPLLRSKHLQVISFDLEGPLRLSDEDLNTMAVRWPDLRNLHLWCHRSGIAPTLTALGSFTTHCPKLRRLELPADAMVASKPHDRGPESPSHALQELYLLGNIDVGESESAAERIAQLCPNLLSFEGYSWDPEANVRFQRIRVAIPSLRRITAVAQGAETYKYRHP